MATVGRDSMARQSSGFMRMPVPRPVHLVYAPDRRQLPKLARFVEFVVGALGTA